MFDFLEIDKYNAILALGFSASIILLSMVLFYFLWIRVAEIHIPDCSQVRQPSHEDQEFGGRRSRILEDSC